MSTLRTPRADDGLLDGEDNVKIVALHEGETRAATSDRKAVLRLFVALLSLCAVMAVPYVWPPVARLQAWPLDSEYVPFWNIIGREFMGQGAQAQAQAVEVENFEAIARAAVDTEPEVYEERKVVTPPPTTNADGPPTYPALAPHPDDEVKVEQSLENGQAIDRYFEALTLTELGYEGAITRASHWGDSVLGNDGITAAIRGQLQARFGDGGHGFHMLSQFNASYIQKGVRVRYLSPWSQCYIINACKSDGHYGFGGTTVWSAGGGETWFSTTTEGAAGRKLAHLEVWYAAQEHGGKLKLKLDKQFEEIIDTSLPADSGLKLDDRVASYELQDGPHEFSLRASGGGQVRAYGVVMERNGPGIVWDGMGLIGSFTSRLLNFDEDHIHKQIRRRDPDMLVFMFGGNDLLGFSAKRYTESLTKMIKLMRAADPEIACLVLSIVDHGERKGGQIVTAPGVPEMVEIQRKVAIEQGCAFWDTFHAMGGEGSMGRWNRAEPRLGSGDLAHLTHHGHKVIGAMLYRALMEQYREFRARKAGSPLPLERLREPHKAPGATSFGQLTEDEGTGTTGPEQDATPSETTGAAEPAEAADAGTEPTPESPEPAPPAENPSPLPVPTE